MQINQIHETYPVKSSWFTCQFLYVGKGLPGGESLRHNERCISRRPTAVPISVVRAKSDARRLSRGEDTEQCQTILWRSGIDPDNPSAGIRIVNNPAIIRFLTFSRETSLVSVAVVIQRWWQNSSLAAFVNLSNTLTVFLKTRPERSRFGPCFGWRNLGYGLHLLGASIAVKILHCKQISLEARPISGVATYIRVALRVKNAIFGRHDYHFFWAI